MPKRPFVMAPILTGHIGKIDARLGSVANNIKKRTGGIPR